MTEYTVKVQDNGTTTWYLNGELHRADGPAIEWFDGDKSWFINGKLHRSDGPAIEYEDSYKEWYLNGERHRTDGPAIEWPEGDKEWYLNGTEYTEGEYLKEVTRLTDSCIIESSTNKLEQTMTELPIDDIIDSVLANEIQTCLAHPEYLKETLEFFYSTRTDDAWRAEYQAMQPIESLTPIRYNHGFDVCFSIESPKEDPYLVTNRQVLAGLAARMDELTENLYHVLDLPASDCFGFMDSYEID